VSSRPPILPAPARFLAELACAGAAVLASLLAVNGFLLVVPLPH